ncbi:hypothetical protein HDV63DRAFT_93280 [Trichoderma sp. SZMC 28014]
MAALLGHCLLSSLSPCPPYLLLIPLLQALCKPIYIPTASPLPPCSHHLSSWPHARSSISSKPAFAPTARWADMPQRGGASHGLQRPNRQRHPPIDVSSLHLWMLVQGLIESLLMKLGSAAAPLMGLCHALAFLGRHQTILSPLRIITRRRARLVSRCPIIIE